MARETGHYSADYAPIDIVEYCTKYCCAYCSVVLWVCNDSILPFQINSDHASYYRDALRYLGCMEIWDIPGNLCCICVSKYHFF